jgi:hypothetical protein
MEKKFNAKWSQNMLADCCWGLIKETPAGGCKRQKKKCVFYDEFVCS